MKKRRKANGDGIQQEPSPRIFPWTTAALVVIASSVVIALAVSASNGFLHGHITKTVHPAQHTATVASPSSATSSTVSRMVTSPALPRAADPGASDTSLVLKYGDAAKSPEVQEAIREVEAKAPSKGAVAAADRYEALAHGHPQAATSSTDLLMYGYMPTGMDPTTAALLSRALPRIPKMPGTFTPDDIDRLSGMPPDPESATLASLGMSRAQIDAGNQQQLERYVREEHGPVYVTPLHADHNWLAEHATKTAGGFVSQRDYDGSIREMTNSSGSITAEYAYDPWGTPTQIAGSGPTPDFLFQGMYYHPRSNNYLTLNRAYNPNLGRWLSRDPVGERMGTNLYDFVGNNPISRIDPSGLGWFNAMTYGSAGATGGFVYGTETGGLLSLPIGGTLALPGGVTGAILGGLGGAAVGALIPDPRFPAGPGFCPASASGPGGNVTVTGGTPTSGQGVSVSGTANAPTAPVPSGGEGVSVTGGSSVTPSFTPDQGYSKPFDTGNATGSGPVVGAPTPTPFNWGNNTGTYTRGGP